MAEKVSKKVIYLLLALPLLLPMITWPLAAMLPSVWVPDFIAIINVFTLGAVFSAGPTYLLSAALICFWSRRLNAKQLIRRIYLMPWLMIVLQPIYLYYIPLNKNSGDIVFIWMISAFFIVVIGYLYILLGHAVLWTWQKISE